jgi:hypothetical protein
MAAVRQKSFRGLVDGASVRWAAEEVSLKISSCKGAVERRLPAAT